MKRIIFLFTILFLGTNLQGQKPDNSYLSAKLSLGFPQQVPHSLKDMLDVKSTNLETGIDSINMYFGTFSENSEIGYWISLFSKENKIFQRFEMQPMDSLGLHMGEVTFKIKGGSMKISTRILYNTETDDVFYTWMNKNGTAQIASIEKVDKAINQNEAMPFFKVEGLNDDKINLDEYKGKYLVINWWATSCKPCIAEMPGLNKMVEKYKSRHDVAFVAIADDNKQKLENFLANKAFAYRQSLSNSETTKVFGKSYPKHIIVNPQGIVTFYLEGGSAEIHHYIEQALASQISNN